MILMNTISLLKFVLRTDQSYVLVIINIPTFSGLLIYLVFVGNIRFCMQNSVIYY